MPGFVGELKRVKEQTTSVSLLLSSTIPEKSMKHSKMYHGLSEDFEAPILPGLPDDVAKHCLALVPRSHLPAMGRVCKKWRSYIRSKEFLSVRRLAGVVEEWLYILTSDGEGKKSRWEVLDCLGHKNRVLPVMPGSDKFGFSVVVLNGKLLVLGGYLAINGVAFASPEVYQYDSCLNSWSKLADMNVARYDFACAEVNGLVYAIGGRGPDGDSLASCEVYDPDGDTWRPIEQIRRPRWGCFAAGFGGELYVMGGRSSFTIGNSRSVDVYRPGTATWREMKRGCVMVTAHAVAADRLFCTEWRDPRKLAVFDPGAGGSWRVERVPLTGSTSVGFRFGVLDRKLLLFSVKKDPSYQTLVYDPEAGPGSEWQVSRIKPSGSCLSCVTIKA